MEATKRQHYVWREYLRAWSHEESIWAYYKPDKKLIQTSLMNVAQGRYFYKVSSLTQIEKDWLVKLTYFNNPISQDLNSQIIYEFIKAGYLIDGLTISDPKEIKDRINLIEKNSFEIVMGIFENLGKDIIKIRTKEELVSLVDSDNILQSIIFVFVQFTRTKGAKDRMMESFSDEDNPVVLSLLDKAWFIISLTYSIISGITLAANAGLRITLLHNLTEINFITGDQPIINTEAKNSEEGNEVKELKLYYPISPKHALFIESDSLISEKCSFEEITEIDTVKTYNQAIIQSSDNFIFDNSNSLLTKIL
ncbi:DUF4238 domain-containing protein [Cellulophaga sp. BC115SP]|uniref:DUF4238 domain-containing protein n=1 Tax=Cellulophaga sp. BC115SP TaxID=2683263 RepID=UPI0014132772|nr:DUF4238 domain-containing protein [Cellulophaga sp. BC115SP]NBB31906.1 DUF4238 domain-containing protein [Cellulophaga sp. BC115SP]